MALDRLGRYRKLPGNLLVGVAASDQAESFPLEWGELIELRIEPRLRSGTGIVMTGEGIEHESGQLR